MKGVCFFIYFYRSTLQELADDVRNAGTYVANKGTGTGGTKFAVYKGVRVGIYVDVKGNPTTIFPDNMEQPGQDGTMEGARD